MNKKKLKSLIKILGIFFILIVLIVTRYHHIKKNKHENLSGIIYTKELNIFSSESGKIKKILVSENAYVKKNDLIIEFDLTQIDKKINNIKATIEHEKSRDNFLKFKEEKVLEEYLNLKKSKNNNLKVVNAKLKELESIQLIRNVQKKRIIKIETELEIYNDKLKNRIMYSPCNGVVQNINVNTDQIVRSNELLLTISDSEHLWLCSKIKKSLVAKYKIGDNFNILINEIPQSKFQGKLFSISQLQKDNLYVELKLSVNQIKTTPNEKVHILSNGMIANLKYE